jgi:hypothetical protein
MSQTIQEQVLGKQIWATKNTLLSLDWDDFYREPFYVDSGKSIYQFSYILNKEGIPIVACGSNIFKMNIPELERKVQNEIGNHLSIYLSYGKIIVATALDYKVITNQVYHNEPPGFLGELDMHGVSNQGQVAEILSEFYNKEIIWQSF